MLRGSRHTHHVYDRAKEVYDAHGVDTESALARLSAVSVSLQCDPADERPDTRRLRADAARALSLIPGHHRFGLHAAHGDFGRKTVYRDGLQPGHFAAWIDWAGPLGIGLDFASTYVARGIAAKNLTLGHPDEATRDFWIAHGRVSRRVAAAFGEALGTPSVSTHRIPHGASDTRADGRRLQESLDAVFADAVDPATVTDAIEGPLAGVRAQRFSEMPDDFYLAYALSRGKVLALDTGHFQPADAAAETLDWLFSYVPDVVLELPAPAPCADGGVGFDADTVSLVTDLIRGGFLGRTRLRLAAPAHGTDPVAAWASGARSLLRLVLEGLLDPACAGDDASADADANLAARLPSAAVWDCCCAREGVPLDDARMPATKRADHDAATHRGRRRARSDRPHARRSVPGRRPA